MYYCEVNGMQCGFETKALRNRMTLICKASQNKRRVTIKYLKATGVVVTRLVAAYSYNFNSGLLYVTDTRHGNKKIRSYKVDKIKSAKLSNKKFKPEWEIKL